jgi:redox-sensitive bicupin YhaK (pirin superfamily)
VKNLLRVVVVSNLSVISINSIETANILALSALGLVSLNMKRVIETAVGHAHGPNGLIKRIVSPSDLGQIIKPFVFLDHVYGIPGDKFSFGFHPHSGIATFTYAVNFSANYVDTEGLSGVLNKNDCEWMIAGGGAWHSASFIKETPPKSITGFQLWLALPPELEECESFSQYVRAADVKQIEDPTTDVTLKVLLGTHGAVASAVERNPFDITLLDVMIPANQTFTYNVPSQHTSSWLYPYENEVYVNGDESAVDKTCLVFSKDGDSIVVSTKSAPARLLLGSAVQSNHDLVLGQSSVHSNAESLRRSMTKIRKLGNELHAQGKL